MQTFWATDGNRKWAVFLFNLSSHHRMYILKYLFSIWDDYFENLGGTTALVCEMFPSGFRPWLKNVACFSSLISDVINRRRTISGSYLTNGRLLRFFRAQYQKYKVLAASQSGWVIREENKHISLLLFLLSFAHAAWEHSNWRSLYMRHHLSPASCILLLDRLRWPPVQFSLSSFFLFSVRNNWKIICKSEN